MSALQALWDSLSDDDKRWESAWTSDPPGGWRLTAETREALLQDLKTRGLAVLMKEKTRNASVRQ